MSVSEVTFKTMLPVRVADSSLVLNEASRRTKIPRKYLEAIGNGRIEALPPGKIYRKNLIKKYAEAVGVDVEQLYREFNDKLALGNEDESVVLRTRTAHRSFLNIPRILGRVAVVMVGLVVLAYVGWQIQSAVRPPLLAVSAPAAGFVTHEPVLTIEGQAAAEAAVTINGEPIYSTGEGFFKEVISLQQGLNEVRITAIKKHGRKTEVVRQVIADLPENY